MTEQHERFIGPKENFGRGSHGSIVNVLIAFLLGWAAGRWDQEKRDTLPVLIPDEEYGPALVRVVGVFQSEEGLDADGRCGPATRAYLRKKLNLDLEAIPLGPNDVICDEDAA